MIKGQQWSDWKGDVLLNKTELLIVYDYAVTMVGNIGNVGNPYLEKFRTNAGKNLIIYH